MPGVIGASIFSPRPARGYRFHSLQVEIILAPSRLRKPQTFSSNHTVRQRYLYCNLNILLQNQLAEINTWSGYRGYLRRSPMMHPNPLQIMAGVAVQSPLPQPSRDRDGAPQPAAQACGRW